MDGPAGSAPVVKVNDIEVTGVNEPKLKEALAGAGYPAKFDFSGFSWNGTKAGNWWMVLLILFIQVIYVTMVYGPIAAFLVELFPTRIRYTSMSLPYHIGNGWFGGMLPLTATALVAANGDIYYGLWYPVDRGGDDLRHRLAARPGDQGPQDRRDALGALREGLSLPLAGPHPPPRGPRTGPFLSFLRARRPSSETWRMETGTGFALRGRRTGSGPESRAVPGGLGGLPRSGEAEIGSMRPRTGTSTGASRP